MGEFGKRWVCFWIVLLLCWQAEGAERRKVGLVLSGGGAKGVAHIGVLKVLEDAGIPVDYVVGTSMGAIVGGLYAIGYDAAALDSMVRSQNWPFLLSDRVHRYDLPFSEKEKDEKFLLTIPMIGRAQLRVPSGFISGQNLRNLFTELTLGYHDSLSFARLPVPYACVAANLQDGEEVVLDHGVLSRAMRASMAIPGVFAPVRWGDMLLVDGGIANNFPTDVCRSMGADIIIGVDVSAGLKKMDELNSILGIVNQLPLFLGKKKYDENLDLCDIYIKPDIEPYSAGSFDPQAIDSLLQRGERAAREQWDRLLALKEADGTEPADERELFYPQDSLIIGKIRFEGAGEWEERWIRRKIGLAEYSYVSTEAIHRAVSVLCGIGAFGQVNYALSGGEVHDLTFTLKTKDPGSLNFGFRFDSETMAAILLNTVLSYKKLHGVELSVTGKLGQNPWAKAECSLGAGFLRRASLSYTYRYYDLNLYVRGEKMTNTTFSQHTGELNFSEIYIKNFKFVLGIRYDYFDVNSFIHIPTYRDVAAEAQKMLSYQVQAQYETLDKRYYPTKGVSFRGEYALHTDNGFRYGEKAPFGALAGYFTTVHRLDNRLVLQPELYGRILIGEGVPFTHSNYIGGEVAGRYFSQQLPFAGIPRVEPVENSILAGGVTIRYRMGAKHYLSAECNYGRSSSRFWDILDGTEMWGGGVAYSYNSLIGPIDGKFGLSNQVKKTGFYVNLGYYF